MLLEEYKQNLAELLANTPKDQHVSVMRHLCRVDLHFLLRHAMNRSDMENQWLFDRCRQVQASPDEYLDLWSRDHYKTTIITIGKTIQDIIRSHGEGATEDREFTIGLFSHTRPIAKAFLRVIKREFEANMNLKAWFPDIFYNNPSKESPKWSEDDGIIVKRKSNPNESTVEAWGVVDGQPISKHFTHMVYDDIVTRDSVNTPEMINKTTEMIELSFNLSTRGGKRRFIGTRYHMNDTYSVLMARGTVTPRLFPATEDGTPNGKPVFLDQEVLNQKRRDMGPYTFAAQMLQNPIADESQGFKRDWIRFYDRVNHKMQNIYVLVDAANSKKRGSDYTAVWVVGLGPDKNFYILEMIRDYLSLTQRSTLVINLHKKWKPHRKGVRYEKYGLMGDIDHLKTEMENQSYRFEIIEVGGNLPKEDRIRRLIPLFEQNRFYFPRQQYYTGHDNKTRDMVQVFLEEEYRSFPVSRHDDMLDSLSRLCEPDLPLVWPKEIGMGNLDANKSGVVNFNIDVFA